MGPWCGFWSLYLLKEVLCNPLAATLGKEPFKPSCLNHEKMSAFIMVTFGPAVKSLHDSSIIAFQDHSGALVRRIDVGRQLALYRQHQKNPKDTTI